ncbi:MAG: PEP-CTERM sorting domain-containing protein [Phycisphaerae bacterium]|jgi:hypothetical protein
MKRRILLTSIISFAIALVAASPAVTEPPVPSWPRGSEGTTYQAWSFTNGSIKPDADPELFNPYGKPDLSGFFQQYIPVLDDKDGIYALRHEIDVLVPNSEATDGHKEIQLCLVWKSMNDVMGEYPDEYSFILNGGLLDIPGVSVTSYGDLVSNWYLGEKDESGWYHSTFTATITPNPQIESFTIKGNVLVDYIAIDTICVPEPATMAIIAVGALVALRRKKNKNN